MTPIPLQIKNFLVSNVTSLDASNFQYPSDLNFYSIYSRIKVYDKMQFILKRNPGNILTKKIVYGFEDDTITFNKYFCYQGYNFDGTCWFPEAGVAIKCYRAETFEEIYNFSDVVEGDICKDYLGTVVSETDLPDEKPEPFSKKDPTYSFEYPAEVIKKVNGQGGCFDDLLGEWIEDIDICLDLETWAYDNGLFDDDFDLEDDDGNKVIEYSNKKPFDPPMANQMINFMKVYYTRNSEKSSVHIENIEV